MQAPSSIEHQPASATIASTLRSEILAGVIAPGVRLRQDGLAARFGTSRIPVREALRQLETEALVVSDGHRGARVDARSRAGVVATGHGGPDPEFAQFLADAQHGVPGEGVFGEAVVGGGAAGLAVLGAAAAGRNLSAHAVHGGLVSRVEEDDHPR